MSRIRWGMMFAAIAAFFAPLIATPAAAFTDNPSPIASEVATISDSAATTNQTKMAHNTGDLKLLNITYVGAAVPMVNISLVDRPVTHVAPAPDLLPISIDG